MTEEINQPYPPSYAAIARATEAAGFTMASDPLTCSLLRTLAASKPGGKFLELGTGTGLSAAWILDGMDEQGSLTSLDNEEQFISIAERFLGSDQRLTLIVADGEEWISNNEAQRFDFIFADTWPGKYFLLDEVLEMLAPGGLFIIDDMLPQANWPEGHDEKAVSLINKLDNRKDLVITKQVWATGIVLCVKR